ncbi:MAG: glycosyltransferase [Candidatus Scalindua sp.]|jgi:glycosyltransferase involved in cell wall biosynthesis|nr:glycosyltransferase [Candidatus Scalindua sp.]
MRIIHILSHGGEHTTARYFERVVRASENTAVYYSDNYLELEKLKQDDILLFVDPAPDWPIGLETSPHLKIAYFIDVHRDIRSRLQLSRFFDAIFVAQKDYISLFEENGCKNVYWLPLACDPEVHLVQSAVNNFEVGFVGKLDQPGTLRNKILTTVLPRYKTNDYKKFYSPHDMAEIYGKSKIVFNASIGGDINMRVFEAMASGALLVTDRIDNVMNNLFKEDIHYVGYSNIEEAIEKIDYYLTNDADRKRIATEGQCVVIERHTYKHRWNTILQLSSTAHGKALAQNYTDRELSELYSDIFVSLRMPWRIFSVIGRYGVSKTVVRNLAMSWGRWLNAKIPMTPNAIRAKFGS